MAALAIAGLLAGTLFAGSVAFASGTGVIGVGYFQLDGDAQQSTNPINGGTYDWDNVYNGTNMGADATTWTTDNLLNGTPSLNASIFTGGGSKDPQDISSWAWKDGAGGLPDKDNLLHAFAARFGNDMYFGSDRLDNSGDAQQGFWFFQNKISLGTNAVGGGSGFIGLHRKGDILVISDFSNGGTTSTITVYEWDPACTATNKPTPDCGDANLRELAISNAANCRIAGDNAPFCGIVDPTDGTIAPWPFTDKSGFHTYLQGEFYEAGIDLGSLGLANECFSTIGAETRSSTSTTATLKDFILGSFAVCGASLSTTASGGGEIGANGQKTISDTATITVTGLTNPPAPAGSVKFYECFSATVISTCSAATGTLNATIDLSTATKVDATHYSVSTGDVTATSAGYYCWHATWAGDSNYSPSPSSVFEDNGTGECIQITPRQPSLHTVSSTTGDAIPGTKVHDTVIFDAAPATPSNGAYGTVAFNLYGPFASVAAVCTGTAAFTDSKTIQAGVTSYTSGDFTTSTPGYYTWQASYTPGTGDNNNKSYTGGCTDANEQFHILQFNPGLTTAQTVTIKDSATITVSGGGNLTGTVYFQPFSDSSCSTSIATAEGVTVSGPTGTQYWSTPMTITATTSPIYWKVWYTSTNPAQTDIAATCTENASITINN